MKKFFFIFQPMFYFSILVLIFFVGCVNSNKFLGVRTKVRNEPSNKKAITGIDTDSRNKYLVLATNSMSGELWDLVKNVKLNSYTPPIAQSNEASVYSIAISPDGGTVVCGGWTGYEWEKSHALFFFDRETEVLKWRMGGFPSQILSLTYSKDGEYLVVTLASKHGIRIVRTSDNMIIKKDQSYYGSSYDADFSLDGMLITASWDGKVRLYEKETFNYLMKKKLPGGEKPQSVSFSKDGTKIAVGFNDSFNVDILSGEDLSYINSSQSRGVKGVLSSVVYSNDSKFLFGAGKHKNNQGKTIIRKWVKGGFGKFTEIYASPSSITDILPLNKGGVVFSTAGNSYGIVNSMGDVVNYQLN